MFEEKVYVIQNQIKVRVHFRFLNVFYFPKFNTRLALLHCVLLDFH